MSDDAPPKTSPADGASAKRRIGPFAITGRLGVGGMGIVYRATYLETGKEVALKVLSPALSANQQVIVRFEREMTILKRLRHPNIVQYFGGGRSGGQNYFAMEFVPGGSVEQMLKEKGKLPWEDALEILQQVAKALEYSHNKGVIHRDLKPANLFFAQDGHVKLGDFGIARDTDATALTAAGKTVGTYAYMAPEQISGNPPVSRRSDLYALGCVGFELLTGRPPFAADTPAEMLMGHLELKPPRVRDFTRECPIWLDEVINRLLEKDPEDRYFDALAAQVAFEEVKAKVAHQESFVKQTLAGATTASATAEGQALKSLVGGKPRKKRKQKRQVPFYERAWFLAGCLAIVVGGMVWALWPPSESELYAGAAALMESEDETDWQTAKSEYLEPLLKRFPQSEHASEARQWIDRADLAILENQVERIARSTNRDPRNETERLLVEAWRAESDDRFVAAAKYQGLIKLKDGESRSRLYVALAQKRLRRLESGFGLNDTEKVASIDKAIAEADELFAEGEVGKATDRWQSVVVLYGDDPELAPYVQYAQSRLAGQVPALQEGQNE